VPRVAGRATKEVSGVYAFVKPGSAGLLLWDYDNMGTKQLIALAFVFIHFW
jgi:hypothetical protein